MESEALQSLNRELAELGNPGKAKKMQSFFRAYPGGYGEGDLFLGVSVPEQRKLAKRYALRLSPEEAEELLASAYHEHRLTALFILIRLFDRTDENGREKIVQLYLRNLQTVNNWDLVDSSAPKILGSYLYNRLKAGESEAADVLFDLARSGELWKQRTAIIATHHFIRRGRFQETLELADILLYHTHDLIHKAVGWMLREVGNRDFEAEYRFLLPRYTAMPRTMLRYAVEKFDEPLRTRFIQGTI